MTDQPTPAAHVIAQLIPALEERTCQQLKALLADHIATRVALTPPHQTLVGVATVISALGRVPAVTEYQAARDNDPSWPHHSSLSRRYGSWIQTVNAAAKLLAHPPRKPQPAPRTQRGGTRSESIQAIQRCAHAIGDWPGHNEYTRWRTVELDIRRRAGTQLNLPSDGVIRRLLGSWPAAVELARKAELA